MACDTNSAVITTGGVAPSLSPGVSVTSRVDCVSRCVLSLLCTSVFFNTDTNTCHLNTRAVSETQMVATNEKIEFITWTTGHCPVNAGFVYNKTLRICYKEHPELVFWPAANATCASENATLVRIISAERNKLMYNIAHSIGGFWTSGNQLNAYPTWLWKDGLPVVEPTFWFDGEPNLADSGERCLTFWYYYKVRSWHSASCDEHVMPFVCEMTV